MMLLVSCAEEIPVEKQCSADDDCVAATCCHPSDAVNVDNAPICKGKLCSQECREGTIDCGQGTIACVEGECKAVLI